VDADYELRGMPQGSRRKLEFLLLLRSEDETGVFAPAIDAFSDGFENRGSVRWPGRIPGRGFYDCAVILGGIGGGAGCAGWRNRGVCGGLGDRAKGAGAGNGADSGEADGRGGLRLPKPVLGAPQSPVEENRKSLRSRAHKSRPSATGFSAGE
jgi:hypothetical protein